MLSQVGPPTIFRNPHWTFDLLLTIELPEAVASEIDIRVAPQGVATPLQSWRRKARNHVFNLYEKCVGCKAQRLTEQLVAQHAALLTNPRKNQQPVI